MTAKQAVSLTARYINALCWAVSGVAVLVFAAQSADTSAWAVLAGLAMTAYGAYVGLTRGSYWVSSYTYVIPIFAVAAVIGAGR